MNRHLHLRTANFDFLRGQPPQHLEWLRIDANDNCNLKCVYCRVSRSDGMIDIEDLQAFFAQNITSVENLQFGCGMEPTIDDRLADLVEMAANSNAKPSLRFSLQTNGLMLHRHDLERFKASGLNLLSVWMISTEPQTHKQLRGGSSVGKIIRNLHAFRSACPDVSIQILAVITNLNIGDAESLAKFAVELGAKRMVFREMVYLPESQNIDHDEVQELIVPPGEFIAMRDRVLDHYEGKLEFSFFETEHLKNYGRKSRADSYPQRSGSKFVFRRKIWKASVLG